MRQVPDRHSSVHIARLVLVSFLFTFMAARCLAYLIMSEQIPDLFLYIGGTHVHHLNYGIFLLSGVGAYLLFRPPPRERRGPACVLYGVGLALTFDEFGMWLHLGGGYWQRASLDAISVIAASLGLVAYAPRIRQMRPRHWWTTVAIAAAIAVFGALLVQSLGYVRRVVAPRLERLDERN